MLITCYGCDSRIRLPDNAAGKRVKCPKCATLIFVPEAESSHERAKPEATGVSSTPLPPPLPPLPPPVPPSIPENAEQNQRDEPDFVECPFCGGEVGRNAIKCRHCGETLDAGIRAVEESKRQASLLAESTDIFGVIGFIISIFANLALLFVCCYGVGVLVAVPLGMVGAASSVFGRGNLRVAGLALNGIAIFIGLIAGAVWLVLMLTAAGGNILRARF
jgi:hypothetical protein